jgi:hypothetical protein
VNKILKPGEQQPSGIQVGYRSLRWCLLDDHFNRAEHTIEELKERRVSNTKGFIKKSIWGGPGYSSSLRSYYLPHG